MTIDQKDQPTTASGQRPYDEWTMAEHLSARLPETHAEALLLLRQTFPDIPLARRVAVCSGFHLRQKTS